MSPKPLAEAYEKLKELRRQGELPEQATVVKLFPSKIGSELGAAFEAAAGGQTGSFIRLLEIKSLAERVFGDEQKAETWLNRANPSFSGQKPIDLLNDELGTAIVREALEQIDHGIFS